MTLIVPCWVKVETYVAVEPLSEVVSVVVCVTGGNVVVDVKKSVEMMVSIETTGTDVVMKLAVCTIAVVVVVSGGGGGCCTTREVVTVVVVVVGVDFLCGTCGGCDVTTVLVYVEGPGNVMPVSPGKTTEHPAKFDSGGAAFHRDGTA